ncbi:hypothetical protein [Enterococcus faecalis]|uniref:hypothetical protein n=1 Tax=Enterococcus faecalis TaxID=1351 RepID=UPI0025B0ABE0|nr:hypothetical protein [Enterococcus faecalis]MDN3185474.1 hypothetical protein [Enterococcus faecalis]
MVTVCREEKLSVIQFATSNNTLLRRHCIVPISFKAEEIRNYLAKSLHVSKSVIELVKEELVFRVEELIDESVGIDNGQIDSYWLDGIEYVVDWGDEQVSDFSLVIAGADTTEQEVKKVLGNLYPENDFRVEYFEECWIKRTKRPSKVKQSLYCV